MATKIKKKVKRYDWLDIFERMFKTFIQGVLSYLVISLNNITDPSEIVIKSLLLGCVASGISAVMNVIIQELELKNNGYSS